MANGDIYLVKDKQLANATEVLNVYHYVQDNGTEGAQELADAFIADLLPAIVDVQTDNIAHYAIEVINLDDPTDFHEEVLTPTVDGVNAVAPMPNFVSWTYKLVRTDRTTRNGRKAIVGVPEQETQTNNPNPTFQPTLDTLAATMALPLAGPGTTSWSLVIYGAPTPPPSSLPLRINVVSDVQFSHLSTQNTRKNF